MMARTDLKLDTNKKCIIYTRKPVRPRNTKCADNPILPGIVFNLNTNKTNGHTSRQSGRSRWNKQHEHQAGYMQQQPINYKGERFDYKKQSWISNDNSVDKDDSEHLKKLRVGFRDGTPDIFCEEESEDNIFESEEDNKQCVLDLLSNRKPSKSILKKPNRYSNSPHLQSDRTMSRQRCHSEPWERDPERLPRRTSDHLPGILTRNRGSVKDNRRTDVYYYRRESRHDKYAASLQNKPDQIKQTTERIIYDSSFEENKNSAWSPVDSKQNLPSLPTERSMIHDISSGRSRRRPRFAINSSFSQNNTAFHCSNEFEATLRALNE